MGKLISAKYTIEEQKQQYQIAEHNVSCLTRNLALWSNRCCDGIPIEDNTATKEEIENLIKVLEL